MPYRRLEEEESEDDESAAAAAPAPKSEERRKRDTEGKRSERGKRGTDAPVVSGSGKSGGGGSGGSGSGSNGQKSRRRPARTGDDDKRSFFDSASELWTDDGWFDSEDDTVVVIDARTNGGFSSSPETTSRILEPGESGDDEEDDDEDEDDDDDRRPGACKKTGGKDGGGGGDNEDVDVDEHEEDDDDDDRDAGRRARHLARVSAKRSLRSDAAASNVAAASQAQARDERDRPGEESTRRVERGSCSATKSDEDLDRAAAAAFAAAVARAAAAADSSSSKVQSTAGKTTQTTQTTETMQTTHQLRERGRETERGSSDKTREREIGACRHSDDPERARRSRSSRLAEESVAAAYQGSLKALSDTLETIVAKQGKFGDKLASLQAKLAEDRLAFKEIRRGHEKRRETDQMTRDLVTALEDISIKKMAQDQRLTATEDGLAGTRIVFDEIRRELEERRKADDLTREYLEVFRQQLCEFKRSVDGDGRSGSSSGGSSGGGSGSGAEPLLPGSSEAEGTRRRGEGRDASSRFPLRDTGAIVATGPTEMGEDGTIVFTLYNALGLFDSGEPWVSPSVTCKQGYALGVEVKAVRDFLKIFLFVAKGRDDAELRWPFDLPVKLALWATDGSGKPVGSTHFAKVQPLTTDAAFARPSPSSHRNPSFGDLHLSVDRNELTKMVYRSRGGSGGCGGSCSLKANDLVVSVRVERDETDKDEMAEMQRRAKERGKTVTIWQNARDGRERGDGRMRRGERRGEGGERNAQRWWLDERGSTRCCRHGKSLLGLDPDRFKGCDVECDADADADADADVCEQGGKCLVQRGV